MVKIKNIILIIIAALGLTGCITTGSGNYEPISKSNKYASSDITSRYYYDGGTIEVWKKRDRSCETGYHYWLRLNGDITDKTVNKMSRAIDFVASLKCNNLAPLVFLNSTGGTSYGGEQLAILFRDNYIKTAVDKNCASACAVAWTGGYYRAVLGNGKLYFHASYHLNHFNQPTCSTKALRLDRAFYIKMLGHDLGNKLANTERQYCGPNKYFIVNKATADSSGLANSNK